MKTKHKVMIVSASVAAVLLCSVFLLAVFADTPDDALVTYGFFKKTLDTFRSEVKAEAKKDAAATASEWLEAHLPDPTPASPYSEMTLPKGSVLVLSEDAEAIFRGGEAIIITAGPNEGQGITDLSTNTECFSGTALQFSHIYYQTAKGSHAYILITGEKAAFTMKGSYEIR